LHGRISATLDKNTIMYIIYIVKLDYSALLILGCSLIKYPPLSSPGSEKKGLTLAERRKK